MATAVGYHDFKGSGSVVATGSDARVVSVAMGIGSGVVGFVVRAAGVVREIAAGADYAEVESGAEGD